MNFESHWLGREIEDGDTEPCPFNVVAPLDIGFAPTSKITSPREAGEETVEEGLDLFIPVLLFPGDRVEVFFPRSCGNKNVPPETLVYRFLD